ncbi:hypothetical protein Lal_00041207 [Lupinus albus]|nr:hypothetical protein Lal_00041207 [Lupinus albus]
MRSRAIGWTAAPPRVAPLPPPRTDRPAHRLVAPASAVLVVGGFGRHRRRPDLPRSGRLYALPDRRRRHARGRVDLQRHRRPGPRREGRADAAAPPPLQQVRVRHAALFLFAQALVGLAVLMQFNGVAILVGLCSLLPVAIYPFMKRVMSLPQLVLGFAFGWGALMGWAAVFARLDAAPLWLYAGSVAWIVGYDTIYAVQDIEDDEIAGIRSSARLFGRRLKGAVGLCYGLASVCVGLAAWQAGAGLVGFLGVAAFAGHLAWQVARLQERDGAGALRLFRSNRDAGLILFAGLTADALIKSLS